MPFGWSEPAQGPTPLLLSSGVRRNIVRVPASPLVCSTTVVDAGLQCTTPHDLHNLATARPAVRRAVRAVGAGAGPYTRTAAIA